MKIHVKSAALTGAIILGAGLFLLTWWMIVYSGQSTEPIFISRFYPGYTITPLGSLLGGLYGAIDGAVFFGIAAWLYNRLSGNAKEHS